MPDVIDSDRSRSFDEVSAQFHEFIYLKGQIDDLTKRQSVIKAVLSELVENEGEVDDKGHVWFELPQEIDGYVSMQRQKRISQKLDADAAEELLRQKQLYDRCFRMMPVLDEDEVMACLYEGLLTEDEIDAMFPKSITWAFVPSKK
jgi:hypothetical protein